MEFDPNDPEQAAILAVRQDNERRLAELGRRGFQVQLAGRAEGILELLLDAVLGLSAVRLTFEREMAAGTAQALDQAEQQVRQQMLTAGVAMSPEDLAAIAAGNGRR